MLYQFVIFNMTQARSNRSAQNDLSFSVPDWKKKEVKELDLEEQQALYMACDYNLNDFKDQGEYQLLKQSQIEGQKESKQIGDSQVVLFMGYLYEIVCLSMQSKNQQNQQLINRNLPIKSVSLEKIFKQKIYLLDVSVLPSIPVSLKKYHKNQIIKKLIFQYITKCLCNVSLVELLPTNNEVLRFAITTLVRTLLYDAALISSYDQRTTIHQMYSCFLEYFDTSDGSIFIKGSDSIKGRFVSMREGSIGKVVLKFKQPNDQHSNKKNAKRQQSKNSIDSAKKLRELAKIKAVNQQLNSKAKEKGCFSFFSCFASD